MNVPGNPNQPVSTPYRATGDTPITIGQIQSSRANAPNNQFSSNSTFQPRNNTSPMFSQGPQKNNMISPIMPGPGQGTGDNPYQQIDMSIDPKIHNEYGEQFHKTGKTRRNGYSTCLETCGSMSRCYCCLCFLCECGPITQVQPGHIGFVMRLGKLKKKVGAGILTYDPCTEKVIQVSIQKQSRSIPGQKLLTRDQLMISCRTQITFNFMKPELVIFKIQDANTFIVNTIMGIIKALVAERTYDQLQNNAAEFNKACLMQVEKKFTPYGINISSMEIRDVMLPRDMIRAMAQVAESKNENLEKINSANGYLKSAPAYAKAAESYKGHKIALELNYYTVLKAMTVGKKSTVFLKDSVINI